VRWFFSAAVEAGTNLKEVAPPSLRAAQGKLWQLNAGWKPALRQTETNLKKGDGK
jgi:hypothetical protein